MVLFQPVGDAAPTGNAGLFVGVNDFDDDTLADLQYAVHDAIELACLFGRYDMHGNLGFRVACRAVDGTGRFPATPPGGAKHDLGRPVLVVSREHAGRPFDSSCEAVSRMGAETGIGRISATLFTLQPGDHILTNWTCPVSLACISAN